MHAICCSWFSSLQTKLPSLIYLFISFVILLLCFCCYCLFVCLFRIASRKRLDNLDLTQSAVKRGTFSINIFFFNLLLPFLLATNFVILQFGLVNNNNNTNRGLYCRLTATSTVRSVGAFEHRRPLSSKAWPFSYDHAPQGLSNLSPAFTV